MAKRATKSPQDGISISEVLDIQEKSIDRLRSLYEQYFLGIQKIPPVSLLREVERTFRDLAQFPMPNTANRFKLSALKQKFGSYNNYWRRTLQSIERGTYKRDIARLSRKVDYADPDTASQILEAMPKRIRHQVIKQRRNIEKRQNSDLTNKRPADSADQGLLDGVSDLEEFYRQLTEEADAAITRLEKSVAKQHPLSQSPVASGLTPNEDAFQNLPPATSAVPSSQQRATPSRPNGPLASLLRNSRTKNTRPRTYTGSNQDSATLGMTDSQVRSLYKKYMHARQKVGNESSLSYDQLLRQLQRKASQVAEKYNANKVEFTVVVKQDKAVLRAKPKK